MSNPDVDATVDEIANKKAEVYPSSAARSQESGNINGPAEDREDEVDRPAITSQIARVAEHQGAAETLNTSVKRALELQQSDPRHENDQRILKAAQEGRLTALATSDPSGLVASGMISEDQAEALPKSTTEQVSKDSEKLNKVEETAKTTPNTGVILDSTNKNSNTATNPTTDTGNGTPIK